MCASVSVKCRACVILSRIGPKRARHVPARRLIKNVITAVQRLLINGAIIAITEVERSRNFHSAAFIKTNGRPRTFVASRRIVRSQFSICAPFSTGIPPFALVPCTSPCTPSTPRVSRLFAGMPRDGEGEAGGAPRAPPLEYRSRWASFPVGCRVLYSSPLPRLIARRLFA